MNCYCLFNYRVIIRNNIFTACSDAINGRFEDIPFVSLLETSVNIGHQDITAKYKEDKHAQIKLEVKARSEGGGNMGGIADAD